MEVLPLSSDRHNQMCRVATGLALACTLLVLGLASVPTHAFALTSDELQAQSAEMSAKLDTMISETDASIEALRETQASIEEVQQLIDETRTNLDEKAKEVGKLQGDLATIIANDYKTRGDVGLMNFILGATDYEDLVSRIYYVERVSLQKQKSLDELVETQDEMMTVQKDLQDKKAGLEELATQQESQVSDLQDAVDAQQSYVDSLSVELQNALKAEQVAQLESMQDEANTLIEEAETSIDPRNVTPSEESAESNKSSDDDKDKEKQEEENSSSDESNSSSDNSDDSNNSDDSSDDSDNSDDSSDDSSSNNSSNSGSPKSQPADSSGGKLSDVANYIGPQASWSSDTGYISSQQQLLNSAGSSTNWGCIVDKGYGRCVVFRKDGGTWKAAMTTDVITTGHTFTGTFSVVFHSRAYWALPDGYDVNDWWVCFIEAWSGDNYSGHLRYEAGKGYDDGQGFHYGYSSGGCTVISNYSTAQWLYDHVPDGSRVVVY